MTPRITWVIVSFNTPQSAITLAESLVAQDEAMQVIIGCNGDSDSEALTGRTSAVSRISLFKPEENLGYNGTLLALRARIPDADIVVLSNADLSVAPDCVARIEEAARVHAGAAMLAPAVSGSDGADQNPNLLAPPTLAKLLLLTAVHRFPYIADLLLVRRQGHSSRHRVGVDGQSIYAAHGSCMIFLPSFAQAGGRHDYPCFLFGEEIWYAKECERIGRTIVYTPSIKVRHREHESTGVRRRGVVARAKYESLRYWTYALVRERLRAGWTGRARTYTRGSPSR
jgi:GT2 family glycosyltransferase